MMHLRNSDRTQKRGLTPPFLRSNNSAFDIIVKAVLLSLLILGIYLVYMPGLNGGFVFDDVPNLGRLAQVGDITDYKTLAAFLLSSDSVHGRPLSLLSFALDDQSWPMDSYTLKKTNLHLHIINTLLLFWCSFLLFLRSLQGAVSKAFFMALMVASLWAFSPFQVSTVSYIIQRMTQLSATFVLVGMISYIKIRVRLEQKFYPSIFLLSVFGIVFTVLGIASKENALLLTAFCGLVEYCFFVSPQNIGSFKKKFWLIWKRIYFFGPVTVFMLYWMWKSSFFTEGFEYRDFTLQERLMTESRVVVDYIFSILIPRMSTIGLFGRDFQLSSSIFDPLETLLSIGFIVLVVVFSFFIKNLNALAAFGIMFYFLGHFIESTFIPLELYFEHRNYLPQFGIWLALIAFGLEMAKLMGSKLLCLAFSIYLSLLIFITSNSALLWGDNRALAERWYYDSPKSLRALQFFASELYVDGEVDRAKALIEAGLVDFPESLSLHLTKAVLKCGGQQYIYPDKKIKRLAKISEMDTAAFESVVILERLLDHKLSCPGLSYSSLEELYFVLQENPKFGSEPIMKARILTKLSDFAVRRRDLSLAMEYLERACEVKCDARTRIRQAELLASAGLDADALVFLIKAETLLRDGWWLAQLKEPGLGEQISDIKSKLKPKQID